MYKKDIKKYNCSLCHKNKGIYYNMIIDGVKVLICLNCNEIIKKA